MELLIISDCKLKIILSKGDMESYNLTAEALDYSLKNTRQTFDEIFELAKRKTGFEIKKGRLFVQVYPSVDGGCEIYLTRLEEICGLVEDGYASTHVVSVYSSKDIAENSVDRIKHNSSIDRIDLYKDNYNGTYFVTARLKKNTAEDICGYIRAYFFESGANRCMTLKKQSFSKERYEHIKTV
ncbi:MAG: adaptor protein MecA [Ruminococcaceae bacterium]|nr:adaptor protein MecA [Oscillospiraceae bacterium]